MAVVLAADSLGAAAAPARTDDGDRGAGQANQDIDVLEDDAQKTKQGGR